MRILSLDLGTTTGWAYSTGVSGVWKLQPRREESSGMRYIKFINSLNEYRDLVDLIVYEEVKRHMGVYAAHTYGGFESQLQKWCIENNTEHTSVPVGTIKKFATGKGNAGKPLMIEAAEKITGRKMIDDNEADAVCLLSYYLKTYGIGVEEL